MKLLPHTAVVALVLGIRDRYRTGRTAFLAVDRVLNAINAIPSATEWQPIETAPRDGTSILVWTGRVCMARWLDHYASGFACRDWFNETLAAMGGKPTHWQPLPAPPETCQDKEL